MATKTIAAIVADLTPEREARLREAVKQSGFALKVLQKNNFCASDIADCEILFGGFAPSDLKDAKSLKWLQTSSAGVDAYTSDDIYPNSNVILTNASGAYGTAISEHLLTVSLMLLRRMPQYIDGQKAKEWKYLGKVRSIFGSTVTVIGIGNIGGNFAKLCHAMGATVRGVKRSATTCPDYIDELFLTQDLDRAIDGADIVAMCLPGTGETLKIMTAQRLKAMKKGALLLNIGRGTAIDQEALIDVLRSGHLGGAALDVAYPEPLPQDSPIWELDSMILTPHVSGNDSLDHTTETIINIFIENLKLYTAGKPLNNVIDRKIGY